MNITLRHSAGFAYDLLAIGAIKAARNASNMEAKGYLLQLDYDIQRQVGAGLHEQVTASPEYSELVRVNEEIYVRVDELKLKGEQQGDALYVDSCNYRRWVAKAALQAKWFPEAQFTEQKFGYSQVGAA